MSKKISAFTSQSLLDNADQFTFVRNATNFKIPFSDLKADLGVTGSIAQTGDPLGAPVLNSPTANQYEIRNLESGPGMQFSVSAQDGIIGKTNFTQGSAGIPIIKNLTDKQQLFRSLVAGDGISIDDIGDDIRINRVDAIISTKTIVISQLSDFPAPIAGVITLEPLTKYQIVNDVTTSNRFVLQDRTVLSGDSPSLSKLAYTGTGAMFTWVNSTVDFESLRCDAPLGSYFSGNSASNLSAAFIIRQCSFDNCVSIGTVGDTFAVRWTDAGFANVTTGGLLFTGSQGFVLLEASFINQISGILLDLGTATFDGFTLIDSVVITTGTATMLNGLPDSGNINTDGIGTIVNNRGKGNLDITNINPDNALWQFALNDNSPDTRPDTLLSMQSNATNTVISSAGVAVLVAGTWIVEETSQMTGDVNGRATYNAGKGAKLPLTASVTIEPVSGGSQDMGIFIAINGVPVANSKRVTATSSGSPATLDAHWQDILELGDFVEVFVSNESGTTDVLVSSAILRIN